MFQPNLRAGLSLVILVEPTFHPKCASPAQPAITGSRHPRPTADLRWRAARTFNCSVDPHREQTALISPLILILHLPAPATNSSCKEVRASLATTPASHATAPELMIAWIVFRLNIWIRTITVKASRKIVRSVFSCPLMVAVDCHSIVSVVKLFETRIQSSFNCELSPWHH